MNKSQINTDKINKTVRFESNEQSIIKFIELFVDSNTDKVKLFLELDLSNFPKTYHCQINNYSHLFDDNDKNENKKINMDKQIINKNNLIKAI